MPARSILQPATKSYEPDGQFGVFPSHRGGETTTYGGYVWEFVGHHPLANKWGFVAQHRLVAEDILGRPLRKGEVVHHHDEVRTNNAPSNLEVMTQHQHRAHHAKMTALANQIPLDRAEVARLLCEHGGVKPAARQLGVSHSTLRLRFPELCAPHQRKSPTKIEEAPHLDRIRAAAADPQQGFREVCSAMQMSSRTMFRICERHGIEWVKKRRSDAGTTRQARAKHDRKPAPATRAG